jgi:hypothetical protein
MSLELLMVIVALGVPLVLILATKLAQRASTDKRGALIGTGAFVLVGALILVVLLSA